MQQNPYEAPSEQNSERSIPERVRSTEKLLAYLCVTIVVVAAAAAFLVFLLFGLR